LLKIGQVKAVFRGRLLGLFAIEDLVVVREKFGGATDIYLFPRRDVSNGYSIRPATFLGSLSRKAAWNSEKNAIARLQSGRAGLVMKASVFDTGQFDGLSLRSPLKSCRRRLCHFTQRFARLEA